MESETPDVIVIGAGPVGLAAAAHLVEAGLTPLVLESGDSVGASMLMWGHVRQFSHWGYNIDPIARKLLLETNWLEPDSDQIPTGRELVEKYLQSLAAHPKLKPYILLNSRVVSVSRDGLDRMQSRDREAAPFSVIVANPSGEEKAYRTRAVIDASGTYESPNPLGSSGVPALGERAAAEHILYRIPQARGFDRTRFAGKRVVVVGGGHSAFNSLVDLVELAKEEPNTKVFWLVRRRSVQDLFGSSGDDALTARAVLGQSVQQLLLRGQIELRKGFRIVEILSGEYGLTLKSESGEDFGPVDEIVANTGFRPDFSMLSEIRMNLDPATEAPVALAPLIDPNIHSCGSVPLHGAAELAHPEENFFVVGMKSYGRAPTFLMKTGYEQVRSVVRHLVGDTEGAKVVQESCCGSSCCSEEVVDTKSCC